MEIEEIKIISMRPMPTDITSCHDATNKFMVEKTEVEAWVIIRNNDIAPLRIWTELAGKPTAKEASIQLNEILFELS